MTIFYWLLYFHYVVAVCILFLFLKVPWVGLQIVIMTFPGHIHLLKEDVCWQSR